MMNNTAPAIARRLRLSTGAIFAALILTGVAFLAVAAGLAPPLNETAQNASVAIEEPLSKVAPGTAAPQAGDHQQASSDDNGGSAPLSR
jgi:hypothetical protein